jgi:hypothetical protein
VSAFRLFNRHIEIILNHAAATNAWKLWTNAICSLDDDDNGDNLSFTPNSALFFMATIAAAEPFFRHCQCRERSECRQATKTSHSLSSLLSPFPSNMGEIGEYEKISRFSLLSLSSFQSHSGVRNML